MALSAYLRLTGETQGEIKGGVTLPGREDSLEVIGFAHEVVSPRDAASGLPTGRRQHKPLTITKPVDKASPLLAQALVTNENLTEVTLRTYRPSRTGTEEQFYTIELVNAQIAGVRTEQLNNQYPENASHEVREHVTFTYERIKWTYEAGGISAQDDWLVPRT